MSNDNRNDSKHRLNRIRTMLSKKTQGYLDLCATSKDYTAEESLIPQMIRFIEDVTKDLPELGFTVFEFSHAVRSRERCTNTEDFHADRVLMALELIPQLLELVPTCGLNPYVGIFIQSAERFDLAGITKDEVHNEEMVDLLNEFVGDVIYEVRSARFSEYRLRSKITSDKTAKSMNDYIDALFARYSRLLVIRVDFGYQKRIVEDKEFPLDPSQVQADRDNLIRYAKRLLGKAMVGHAWKLEYGVLKSYHLHMVFFLDGRKKHGDIFIGNQLGQYWVQELAHGLGTFYNCNAQREKYRYPAVGMIHHADHEKRNHLEDYVVQYLTKSDDYMRLLLKGRRNMIRAFGKGATPSRQHETRRGRPRTVGNDSI
jgi:hypothetical protein